MLDRGLYSSGILRNACWVRAAHLSARAFACLLCDVSRTRGSAIVCVGTQEEAFSSGIDADASTGNEQTDPAGFLGRGGADGSSVMDVCLPL